MACVGIDSGRPAVSFGITDNDNSLRVFINDGLLMRTLDELKSAGYEECRKAFSQGKVRDIFGGTPSSLPTLFVASAMRGIFQGFQAHSSSLDQPWTITQNLAKANELQRLAAVQAQEVARQQQARIMEIRQGNRANFLTQTGATRWVARQNLITNPFVFNGTVVVVGGTFIRMIGNGEALIDVPDCFIAACPDSIVVTGVPNTAFGAKATVIVAVRVRGMRTVKTATGEATIPDLQFVGAQLCRDQACSDFGQLNYDGGLTF